MIILLETLKEVSNAIIDFTLDACAGMGVCVGFFLFCFYLVQKLINVSIN